MKNIILGWAILALILTVFSLLAGPWLTAITPADAVFARDQAGEILALLEEIEAEAGSLGSGEAFGTWLDRAADLASRKHAALFLKGDIARDFVYALDCAEAWCRASADAVRRPGDPAAPRRAKAALASARRELSAIQARDYTAQGR